MPVSDEYMEFTKELLAEFEPLRIKRMFGGAGVYSGELFFAILVDDELYLKVDDINRPEYEQRGLGPFVYRMKNGRTSTMSYYPAPADVLEDPPELSRWVRGALEAAERGKK
jgi:DNA transformation protein